MYSDNVRTSSKDGWMDIATYVPILSNMYRIWITTLPPSPGSHPPLPGVSEFFPIILSPFPPPLHLPHHRTA